MSSADGWENYTAVGTDLKPLVISLGRQIGNIDVRCNLVRWRSKWHTPQGESPETPPGYPLRGLLYFEFEFRERKGASLMSATITITLQDACGRETIFVDRIYPNFDALKPADAPMKDESKDHGFEVDPNAQTSFGGARVGKFSRGSTSKSKVEQTWSFQGGKPSGPGDKGPDDQAEFSWRRNTSTDWTGTDRGYHGALAVRRASHRDIKVEVLVDISDKNNLNFARKKAKSAIIDRGCGTSSCEKEDFDAWKNAIIVEIFNLNQQRKGPRKVMPQKESVQSLIVDRPPDFHDSDIRRSKA